MNILAPHSAIAEEVAGRSLWQDALARLARNRAAVVSLAVLAVIALMALLAPWISPHPFDEVYWDDIARRPASPRRIGAAPAPTSGTCSPAPFTAAPVPVLRAGRARRSGSWTLSPSARPPVSSARRSS